MGIVCDEYALCFDTYMPKGEVSGSYASPPTLPPFKVDPQEQFHFFLNCLRWRFYCCLNNNRVFFFLFSYILLLGFTHFGFASFFSDSFFRKWVLLRVEFTVVYTKESEQMRRRPYREKSSYLRRIYLAECANHSSERSHILSRASEHLRQWKLAPPTLAISFQGVIFE